MGISSLGGGSEGQELTQQDKEILSSISMKILDIDYSDGEGLENIEELQKKLFERIKFFQENQWKGYSQEEIDIYSNFLAFIEKGKELYGNSVDKLKEPINKASDDVKKAAEDVLKYKKVIDSERESYERKILELEDIISKQRSLISGFLDKPTEEQVALIMKDYNPKNSPEYKELEEENNKLKEEKNILNKSITSFKRQVTLGKNKVGKLNLEKQELSDEIIKLNNEIIKLEEAIETYEELDYYKKVEELKREVQAKQKIIELLYYEVSNKFL